MAIKIRAGKRRSGAIGGTHKTSPGCGMAFGLLFAAIGLLVTAGLVISFLENLRTWSWEPAPCVVERCEIVVDRQGNEDSPFKLEVQFRVASGGREFVSNAYSVDEKRSGEYETLALLRRELLTEPNRTCYLDPKSLESRAILVRGSLWMGLIVLFPLLFVAIGGVVFWFSLQAMRKKRSGATAKPGTVQAISSKGGTKKPVGSWVLVVFFGIFAAVGLGLAWPLGVKPFRDRIASNDWVETPCTIIWSEVDTHTGDDSTTYSVDIFYEYEFNGETHRSNRYRFIGGSSSGYQAKRAVVDQYPPGSQRVCYVDPETPERAVLVRSLGGMMFLSLIPLVFGGVGVLGLMGMTTKALSGKTKAPARDKRWTAGNRAPEPDSEGNEFSRETSGREGEAKVLQPHGSRWGLVIGSLVFGGFWNGVLSVFLYQLISAWSKGNPDWFLALFLTPFVLVGLGLILFFFYSLLGVFNPRPILTLTPGRVRLGEPVILTWELPGGAGRLRDLRIYMKGTESATYRRGTDTVTDTEVFYGQDIKETTSRLEMHRGTEEFALPHDLVPTWDSANNRIRWEVVVTGSIPFWPDVNDSYSVEVLPGRPGRR